MLAYIALGIFFLAFAFIVFEVFDKSLIALSGALLMVVLGILGPEEALEALNMDTILLLMAMMVLVNIASKSGIFAWLNVRIASVTKGNPLAIFLLFSILTGVCSAFLDNVTTVVLIVPLTIELVKGMGKDPKPYIFAEIFFANIGGALTLIGDPSNIIIGGASGFNFLQFIQNMWIPVTLVSMVVLLYFVALNWRNLKPISKNLVDLCVANVIIRKIQNKFVQTTLHKDFVIKVLLALVLTIVAFLLQSVIGLPNYVIALVGAIMLGLMTTKRIDIHESFKSVEWTTLFFFAGLFVMVAGVEKTGLLEEISNLVAGSTTNVFYLSLIVLWVCGFVSMVVDNIPFVTVMVPVIAGIQSQMIGVDTSILWWALSMGACLGGTGTLVGGSANVVSAGLARREGVHITFLEYFKFSFPLTVSMLIVCSAYLFFAAN